MNNLRNRVQLIGRIGLNPEIRNLAQGKTVARINLATNDYRLGKDGEKIVETQWHNLIAWGKTASYIEKYLTKGQEIAIEGRLTSRSYEDKDGNRRYITEIVIQELLALGSRN